MNPGAARKILKAYAGFALIWTPLTDLLFVGLFSNADRFATSFLQSLVISETVAFACFWGGFAVGQLQKRYFHRRGWAFVERQAGTRLVHGSLFMLPGMYLGFRIVTLLTPALGWRWGEPDLSDYRTGIVFGAFSATIFLVLELRKEARLAKQRAVALTMKAQISALTAQVNPHLLFNSLNSIASTIRPRRNAPRLRYA